MVTLPTMVGNNATAGARLRAGVAGGTCGEAIVWLLEQYGVDTVFGIPGVHTLEVYRGLSRSRIRHVLARHEQGAGFMADGYGRVRGEPGVCVVISGPGVTNVLTPVAQAYHDSRPLLVLSGAVSTADRGRDRGALHDLPDQRALMAQVTAFSHTVADPGELPSVFARAWEVFTCGRPRPVHIEVPVDVLSAGATAVDRIESTCRPPVPPPASVRAAAAALWDAAKPAMLLGGGAAESGAAAVRLAERIGAPIGLTINAKGAVSSSHPLCLGATLTFRPTRDVISEAGVLLAAGTQFSHSDWWETDGAPQPKGTLIRADIDRSQLDNPFRASIALPGDSAATLDAITAALPSDKAQPDRLARAASRAKAASDCVRFPPEITDYRDFVDALDAALPDDRIIVGDSTQPVYAANHLMPATQPRSWIMPIGYGTLGCALPMAVGAKLAAPSRPVVCLVGDGGVLFTLQELATAQELGLPLPVIVWSNRGYGEIRDAMERAGIPPSATEAQAHDLVQIATGFGCRAERLTTLSGLGDRVRAALESPGPTLLEVRTA
jgi:acetolactate synthase I/II/III large subunit